jgi:hypothetical protein
LAAQAEIARPPHHEPSQRTMAKPRHPVNWEKVAAIAGVIGVLIALGAWLVPHAADWLFKTPTAIPTSNPTHSLTIPTATPTSTSVTPTATPTFTPSPIPTRVLPTDTPLPPTFTLVPATPTITPTKRMITVPELVYIPLSLTSIANEYMSGGYAQPPVGKVELEGVLFDLPLGRNSVTTQAAPLPDYPTRVEITADISQPRRVYLLITGGNVLEKYMGQRVGVITLLFGGGETSLPLIAGENVREWKILEGEPVVQTVTDPAVQEVWSTPSKFDGIGIIDMLTIDVPVEYQFDRLLAITVEDTSVETVGDKDPAINLLGVTVLRQS